MLGLSCCWSCYQSRTASGRGKVCIHAFSRPVPAVLYLRLFSLRLERLMPHASHFLRGRCYCVNSTDNPSSGPSCSTRSQTGWCPRSEPCSGRLDSTRLPRAERTAGRPTGRSPATRCLASKGRLGSPVRPSELALWVRPRRPAEDRPPTSSGAAGGTSFRFTPGPRSATRSMG